MTRQIVGTTTRQIAGNRAVQQNIAFRTGRGFIHDDTEPDEERFEEELDVEVNDASDDEEDEAPDYDSDSDLSYHEEEARPSIRVRPIWLWCGGRIVWATDRFGYHLSQRERFRRKFQNLLDCLRSQMGTDFPEATAPWLLREFFTKQSMNADGPSRVSSGFGTSSDSHRGNEENGKGVSWTAQLGRVGLIVERTLTPLDLFIMGQGKKNPEVLEREWLKIQLKRRGIGRPKWKLLKDWLPDEINAFFKDLNAPAGTDFHYAPSTLQRKKLAEWSKWDIWSGGESIE